MGAELQVAFEPDAKTPRQRLEQLLSPHGLRVENGPGNRLLVVTAPPRLVGQVVGQGSGEPLAGVRVVLPEIGREARTNRAGEFQLADLAANSYRVEVHLPGFVIGQLSAVEVAPGQATRIDLRLVAVPRSASEIVVMPSIHPPSQPPLRRHLALQRSDLDWAPRFGDDPLRAASSLPSTLNTEASAAFGVRGGRNDEILVQLDGLELLVPYHLQDFDSAISLLAPQTLDSVQLMPSSYSVEYGDRMGGVLDLTTLSPASSIERRLGVTQSEFSFSAAGALAEQRLRWLTAARAGSHHDALERNGREGDPSYWDVMAKVEFSLGGRQGLRFNSLVADDRFEFQQTTESDDNAEQFKTHWQNRYFWLTHSALLRPNLSLETVLSTGRVSHNRSGQAEDETTFDLRDDRDLALAGLKQRWQLALGDRHRWQAGFELRRLRANYNYSNNRRLDSPLAALRSRSEDGNTSLSREFPGDLGAIFVADQLEFGSLELEFGLRADRSRLTDDRQISPRLALAWQSSERTVWRASWGIFHQSQRSYELQVGDGESAFGPAERAEHRGLGFEHRWPAGTRLAFELYDRRFSRPRPRWENLFSPLEIFPELAVDRIRVAPDSGYASGVELGLQGAPGHRLSWELAYAYSVARDHLDGREVPRANDQPHSLRANLGWRLGSAWQLRLAWQYHTGWPTTALSASLETAADGSQSQQPVLGPLRAERLPAYHRLDLRLSRELTLPYGRLAAYVDLHNAYSRPNVRGFDDLEFGSDSTGQPLIESTTVTWGGLLPTVGLSWTF